MNIPNERFERATLTTVQRQQVLNALVETIALKAKHRVTSGLVEAVVELRNFDSYCRAIPADKALSSDENALSSADTVFLKASEAIRKGE